MARALDHAHRRGVFHRDLKPSNVIIDREGRPYLTDFGLARQLNSDSELTAEGTVLGTPAYMSPEQAAGRARHADARSDIYSLGVILYELLCRRRPTDLPSNTPIRRIERTGVPPPRLRTIDESISAELDAVCAKALAVKPDDRYRDAETFAKALDHVLDAAKTDATKTDEPRPKAGERRWNFVGLLVSSALAVVFAACLSIGRPGVPIEKATPSEFTFDHAIDSIDAVVPEPTRSRVVVNVESRKIHVADCSTLRKMADKNRETFESIEAAEKAGYSSLCKTCAKKIAKR